MSATAQGVIYEVSVDLESAIADEYHAWLRQHIAEMLALPGFLSAQVFDVLEPVAAGRVTYCVHYRLRDATALADYLRDHAARMRNEGAARFSDRFRASRRVLRESN